MPKVREIRVCSRTTRISVPDAVVSSPRAVYDLSKILLNRNEGLPPGEVFLVLFLNAQNQLLNYATFPGGCTVANIDLCHLARLAVLSEAIGVILAHNHPSGNVSPSQEDIIMTLKISKTFRSIGMTLHDHIIVSRDDFTSLREEGHYIP